jgi:hypothetical protein
VPTRTQLSTSLLCALVATQAAAQDRNWSPGPGGGALDGLVHTAMPHQPAGFALAATGAYGYTESVGPVDGAHHRGAATLAGAVAPTDWLSLALRFDGRLDAHPDDGMGSHTGGVGDPRLTARAGHDLSSDTQLGGELTIWVPGEDAPSVALDAATVDLRALFAHGPAAGPWMLLGAAGYRLDNSAGAAPDLSRVRPGDRVALGLSDSDAVLLALGFAYAVGADDTLFVELSADFLTDAEELSTTPLRATLGQRHSFSDALSGEVSATASLSQRPDLEPTDPLIPVEPRVLLAMGLRFGQRFSEPEPEPTFVPPDEPEPEPEPEPAPEPEPPATVLVEGQLLDDQQEPLTEAEVVLTTPDGAEQATITDAEGRYRFEDVPAGPVTLVARARGFEELRWQLDAAPNMPAPEPMALTPRPPSGVIRGLARSFDSEPLAARVRVLDKRGREVVSTRADAEGRFEIPLPPGSYRVVIDAEGYRGQKRRVRIRDGSVNILNVDLREQKR